MSLVCPYCQKEFEAKDILFYTDVTDSDFFKQVSGERNVAQTGAVSSAGNVSDFRSVTQGTARSSFRSYTSTAPQQEKTSEEKEEHTGNSETVLGKSVEDEIATKFLKDFGEGSLFRFQRTAVFYGIKEENEIAEDDTAHGFVEEWEGTEQTIPLVLYVPSRPLDRRRLTERVCPKCHCNIPKDYFNVPEENKHSAALAGCTSAGKTQFITVSLRDLVKETFRVLHLGRIEWTPCSGWFHNLYVKQYETNEGTMDGTRKEFRLFPLMLRVITENKQTHFVTFYDCAGEYANNQEFASNQTGFRNASVLLLMIDCIQLFPDLKDKLNEGELACKSGYYDATYPLREYRLCPNLKKAIVVITKSDVIINEGYIHGQTNQNLYDSMTCFGHNMNCHRNTVDLATIQRIHDELNNMLTERGEPEVPEHVADDLSLSADDVNLLAVSTYCWKGQELVNAPTEETGHHRITEPLLLAFYEWGILPGELKDPPEQPAVQPPVNEEPPRRRWLFGRR